MTDSRQDLLLRRFNAIHRARNSLIEFVKLLHEDPADPDDPDKTTYVIKEFHQLIAKTLERVEKGELRRVIITMPPRHGKTELVTKSFVPWYLGRNPIRSAIVATYSDQFAGDLGRDIRANIMHPAFSQVFDKMELRSDSKASNRMMNTQGGSLFAVGRNSAITGRGGDILVLDDPTKNSQEAQSKTIREGLWTWFTQVFLTRLMSDKGAVLVVQTRWHEDDLIGRLLDPHNPHYDPREAAKWHVLELPAIAGKKDPLKRKPGEPLWPERFGLDYLEEQKAKDPRGFNALYQGQPSAETGSFFNERDLLVYGSIKDLPSDLRYYVASDHAVGLKQENDLTCCIPIGIDSEGTAWIHPDIFWDKADTATVVARMIRMIKQFKPLFWWAESGAISKAIGPFLRKQMVEEQAICTLIEVPAITDKMQRAQSIHGRISLGRVRFPAFALWWPDAKRQILQFPYGAHDDFVDTLSLLGMGLQQQIRASAPRKVESDIPKTGSLAWVKWASDQERKRQKNKATTAGW